MEMETAGAATLARLIAMKREELDRFRQDLGRLRQLAEAAAAQLHQAREEEGSFLEETRQAEHAHRSLDAMEMIGRRRYLAHLQSRNEARQAAFDQAAEQRERAHRCLQGACAEMRTLERLLERRLARAAAERQRIEYLRADDQEIARNAHGRGVHVQY